MDVGFIWVLLIASVARLLGFHIHDDMREKAGVRFALHGLYFITFRLPERMSRRNKAVKF